MRRKENQTRANALRAWEPEKSLCWDGLRRGTTLLLQCDVFGFDRYVSQAQRSRVISEAWFSANAYCLSCDSNSLKPTEANTKARDFVCQSCRQNYELKTFKVQPKRRLIDGAYQPLMDRILDGSAPALMMLERDNQWQVRSLTAVHHLFLTPEIVERRKPLALTARRAGWVGCNIRLDLIASDAKVNIISGGKIHDRRLVRQAFQRFANLERIAPSARGWTTLILRTIQSFGREFSLEELYAQEHFFAGYYPSNKNIRPKIRQQLQVLRDLGFLLFLGRGHYKSLP